MRPFLTWRLAPAILAACLWGIDVAGASLVSLAPVASANGVKAGFQPRKASELGIPFINSLSDRVLVLNHNLMNGSGVAAGDYNNDGLVDLFFAGIGGSNGLFKNLGGWKFEDATAKARIRTIARHPTGALFSDLDADGRLDLLVGSLGQGVQYFRNLGNGEFTNLTERAGLSGKTGSTSMAMADVDGDGDLDLYVCNYGESPILRNSGEAPLKLVNGKWTVTGPHAKRLKYDNGKLEELGEADVLYLNDGTGRFKPLSWNSEYFVDETGKPQPEPIDFGLAVQMRDINGDGAPDIYVCNDFQTPDRIWINDGKGRFRALPANAMRKESFSAMAVDFADADRDGLFDFLVVEMRSRSHQDRMRHLTSAPVNNGLPAGIFEREAVSRNTFFHNLGAGAYQEIAQFSGIEKTDWSWQSIFLDVDLDGYEDLLICNGMARDIVDKDVAESIQKQPKMTLEQSRSSVLRYPPEMTPNYVFRNNTNLTFSDRSNEWNFNSREISQGAALADFDQDGDLDVVINTFNSAPLFYENIAAAPRIAVRLVGPKANAAGIGALIKVMAPGFPMQMQQVLSGGRYLSGDEPIRAFACGLKGDVRVEVKWPDGTASTASGGPNHLFELHYATATKGRSIVSNPPPPPIFSELTNAIAYHHADASFDDFERQATLPRKLSQAGPGLGLFDIDGDGWDELFIGPARGEGVAAFKWKAGKFERLSFAAPLKFPDDSGGFAAWSMASGKRSLLLALGNYEAGASNHPAVLSIALGPNTNQLSLSGMAGTLNYPSSPGPIAVADINGDGRLELFIGGRVIPGKYPASAVSQLFKQGDQQFELDQANTKVLANAGMINAAIWTDLNNDGFPELVLACEWGPIRIYTNRRGRLVEGTKELGLEIHTGWWNFVFRGHIQE